MKNLVQGIKKKEKLTWDMLIDYKDHINMDMYEYLYDKFNNAQRRVYFVPMIQSEPYSNVRATHVSNYNYILLGGTNLESPDEGDAFIFPSKNKEKMILLLVTKSPVKSKKGFLVEAESISYVKKFPSEDIQWLKEQFFISSVRLYNGF